MINFPRIVKRNITIIITTSLYFCAVPLTPAKANPLFGKPIWVASQLHPPADTPPGPNYPFKQKDECVIPIAYGGVSNAFASFMRYDQIHKIARGNGQIIAVIDTGVQSQRRLPHLKGGGDYIIPGENGLSDCDGHGTLVAGIIGAAPSKFDNFVGVAPDATIVSIRQLSEHYRIDTEVQPSEDEEYSNASGNLASLARSIVHAADLGAHVINLSITKCFSTGIITDGPRHSIIQSQLALVKSAIWYAAVKKDAVIIAASGNNDNGCDNNPDYDPAHPNDIRNWEGVDNISFPSYYQPLVLSVAATTSNGIPINISLSAPWIGVAAPGMNISSLGTSPRGASPGGLVNSVKNERGKISTISGTSFAAPLVAGLAVLLRERFPQESAHQIINRIIATAHHPSAGVDNKVGWGIIDPLAALTHIVTPSDPLSPDIPATLLPPPPPPAPIDNTARNISLLVTGAAVISIIIVGITVFLRGNTSRSRLF